MTSGPPPAPPARATRLARSCAALVAVVALVGAAAPGAAAVDAAGSADGVPAVADVSDVAVPDVAVVEADAALRTARAALARAQDHLDTAAEAFERARAHHERLGTELAAAEERAASAADASAETADAAAAAAAVEAYKRGVDPAAVAESALRAGDLPTALHQADLVERLTVRGAAAAARNRARARAASARAEDLRLVTAGVGEAVAARRAEADALSTAVADAHRDVDEATAALDAARRDAAARAEAAATAQAASASASSQRAGGEPTDSTRRTASAAPTVGPVAPAGTSAAPLVDGKACPVAQPNGFIDSWGFPRSGGRTHKGVDMFAAYGTPLHAVEDGTVRVSTNRLGGLSINLSGTSGNGYYYAHLSSTAVTSGQTVRVGDVIGAVGDSGNAKGTPPHLHWEVRPGGGGPVNPYPLAHSLCRGHGTGM